MSGVRGPDGFVLRRAEPVMGTVVSFDVRPRGLAAIDSRAAVADACAVLHAADDVFSLYRPQSPMSRLRRGELSRDDAPAEIDEVLVLCAEVRELSEGWFDPWALPGGLDPTGLVKGWSADRAMEVLKGAGVGAAMINAAGDIALLGEPGPARAWQIGIRSPHAADRLLGTVAAVGAVATSGLYERGAHVMDPFTGAPAATVRSATVCGPRLAVADGLATGLLAAGRRGLRAVAAAGYEAMIVDADDVLVSTSGFPILPGGPTMVDMAKS